ncbi:IreB family regulatory phosphoprotein [Citroniella saccharovorans]|uniref:UPF0297 protein VLK81_07400 n=1 Tax=Citroniella saccharovorans TaxID=2053367 RepID=A0AAW9MRV1_9FIRM|nr:IreB family regulatory phosphoprotein [Citroniella saccharovorans]MEB3429831.1 IreB family regulatory phosphoprotein [Citroniella saccharovorans]
MNEKFNETMRFEPQKETVEVKDILTKVYSALEKKGYDPKNQIIGYILSGDPTYITSHDNARNLIRRIDRDKILGELLDNYLKNK